MTSPREAVSLLTAAALVVAPVGGVAATYTTGYAEDGEMTFEEFASRWLNRQTKYAPSTIAAYRRMLEVVYPMIGGIRLNKLRPMALENMLSELRKRKPFYRFATVKLDDEEA